MNSVKLNKKVLGLSFLLSFSSFHFEKTFGILGLVVYPVLVYAVLSVILANRKCLLNTVGKLSPHLFFSAFMLFIILVYSVWYPYENKRSIGTDRDEALNQAGKEIVLFHYPYYERTVVEGNAHKLKADTNPITVLPGSIIFALPFVLMGNSTFQNFFWMIVLYLAMAKYFCSYNYSVFFIIQNFFLCLTMPFQIFIGSDYIANSIWLLVLSIQFIKYASHISMKSSFYAILLGVGLASRFNFLMIMIPITCFLYLELGIKKTLIQLMIVLFSFGLVVAPFALYDYNSFTPIHCSNLFSRYNKLWEYSSMIFPFITLLMSMFISIRLIRSRINVYFIISLILFLPVLIIVLLDSLIQRKLTFELSHYAFPSALFCSFFVFNFYNEGELSLES